eukprot:CAMPEP_0178865610 /NCGR_PEP_ID=MMETSP0747-20121128/4511_1 /TAXON_ID=913974 /ORGANISM="Nitzschia punctata, Strain CCMP561" /LENGTH=369 /DNA_ID=CAMNT_0020532427 /DNA_START=23 /DNA_END=1132 /DNA_ORIENTATION=+
MTILCSFKAVHPFTTVRFAALTRICNHPSSLSSVPLSTIVGGNNNVTQSHQTDHITGATTGATTTTTAAATTSATTRVPTDSTVTKLSQQNQPLLPNHIKKWLDVSLPEGRCIGVMATNGDDSFPHSDNDLTLGAANTINNNNNNNNNVSDNSHWMETVFHPSEIAFGRTLKCSRTSFWLGRLAIRIALEFPDYPVLKDSFGRPILVPGIFGSISHKQNRGVAILSSSLPIADSGDDPINKPGMTFAGIGVDLEMTSRPGRPSIAKKVLTEAEREALGGLPGISPEEEVLLRFSLKEAIYKAAHPLLCQYVGFQEAEVTPLPDGTATCKWFLDTKADEKITKLTAHWIKLTDEEEEFFLTSASVYSNAD